MELIDSYTALMGLASVHKELTSMGCYWKTDFLTKESTPLPARFSKFEVKLKGEYSLDKLINSLDINLQLKLRENTRKMGLYGTINNSGMILWNIPKI